MNESHDFQIVRGEPSRPKTRSLVKTDPGANPFKIVIDPKSLPYLDGTELDFAREGLNEGFRFNNPNAKDECGCGESFRV